MVKYTYMGLAVELLLVLSEVLKTGGCLGAGWLLLFQSDLEVYPQDVCVAFSHASLQRFFELLRHPERANSATKNVSRGICLR